jgi:hypothetical protein
VFNNRHYFEVTSKIHNINTRTKLDLHHPLIHLAVFQKGIYYAGIRVFNNLPDAINEQSHNTKQFELELKNFLHSYSFYTLDEYFNYKTNKIFI